MDPRMFRQTSSTHPMSRPMQPVTRHRQQQHQHQQRVANICNTRTYASNVAGAPVSVGGVLPQSLQNIKENIEGLPNRRQFYDHRAAPTAAVVQESDKIYKTAQLNRRPQTHSHASIGTTSQPHTPGIHYKLFAGAAPQQPHPSAVTSLPPIAAHHSHEPSATLSTHSISPATPSFTPSLSQNPSYSHSSSATSSSSCSSILPHLHFPLSPPMTPIPAPQPRNRSDSQPRSTYIVNGEEFKIWSYFTPTAVLGFGAYGVVIEALDTRTNRKVAIKKNKHIFADNEDSKRLCRELMLLQHFNHQNIVSLLDVVPPATHERDSYDSMYLVMPRLEGTLKKLIASKHSKMHDYHRMFIVFQMLCALQHLHSAGVIHRDLTPDNVLVDSELHVKIIDFGLSRGVAKENELLTEYVCTRWYRAPEIMVSRQRYGTKVDVWAVGCIWAEMLLGRPLFQTRNHFELLSSMLSVLGSGGPRGMEWMADPEASQWVRTLKPSPGVDLRKLFNNTVPEAVDVLSTMLVMNPKRRCSVDEALAEPYFHRYEQYFRSNRRCAAFEVSASVERAMNTSFGARSVMYDELVAFRPAQRKRTIAQQ